MRIFYFYFLITRYKYILLTFTSSSRPSSCDFRSSISDSISSTDWLLCSLTNLFFTPGFILFKNPFWLLESAFNCLLASLTRMIMLSRSLIFCANCLLSSWAYQIVKHKIKMQKKSQYVLETIHSSNSLILCIIITCFILCFSILVSSLWACNKLGSSPWAPTRRSKALPCLFTKRFNILFSSFKA